MDFFRRLTGRPKLGTARPPSGKDTTPDLLFFDGVKAVPLSKSNGLVGQYTSGSSTYIPHTPKGRLRDDDYGRAIAALASEYAFNCIRLVATEMSGIPLKVRSVQTQDDFDDHALNISIKNARLYYQQDTIPLWQFQRYIFGEVYILPEWNDSGLVNCLRLLNPLAIEKYVPRDRLEGFDYQAGFGFWRFAVGEMAFDKVSNPLDDINGLAPMSVALDAINVDKEIKRYTLDAFTKDMRMSGIITGRQGTGVGINEVQSVLRSLNEQKDSRLIALPWQLEYQRVQQEIDDSQIKLSEEARRRIAAALGIPMSVAGAWDSATFQSAPAQMAHYYRSVIFPECKRQAQFINDFVMPFVDNSGLFEAYFDTTEQTALIEDKKTKTDLLNSELSAGAITRKEYREALDMTVDEGDDVFYIPSSAVITPRTAPVVQPIAPAVPVLPTPQLQAPALEPTKDMAGMKSAYITLTTPSHPDLISLQRNVRQYAGEVSCEWNDPASFHVTLIAIPAIADEQIDALIHELDELEIPELALNVGSLNTFDTGTNYAVHFKLRRNLDLSEFQESLYDLCESMGLAMSSYSAPESYKPHITMAYATQKIKPHTFNSKIMVRPVEMQLSSNGNTIYRKSCAPNTPPPPKMGKGIEEAALAELHQWRKKVKNAGAQKAINFTTYLIRDEIADEIRKRLTNSGDTLVNETFDIAGQELATKAVQATRIDFEDAFEDVLKDAVAGNLKRSRFTAIVKSLIAQYGNKAYRDGLADAGIDDEPDADEQSQIDDMITAQSVYVTGLADTLYKSEDVISDDMAAQKPPMWWNGSLAQFYSAGVLSGDSNSLYTWVLGNTEQHCQGDGVKWGCANLEGTSKRYKTWDKLGLIAGSVGQDTVCGGWQCDCHLVRKAGKSSSVEITPETMHVHA